MAGDWIKMSTGLRSHPKVVRISSALHADRLRVVGGLWAVWCVFDEHSVDGCLEGYTLASMDEEIGWQGFGAAMQAVGWLEETGRGLHAPSYESHNGPVAKRRAMDASRKGATRKLSASEADTERTNCGQMSAFDADKVRNREEKRREERNTCAPNAVAFDAEAGSWSIPDLLMQQWRGAYPALSLDAELAKASAWLVSNPRNRKSNYARFLTNWLTKAQDRAPRAGKPSDDLSTMFARGSA